MDADIVYLRNAGVSDFQLVLFWLAPNFDSLISAFIKINPRLGLREFSFSNFQKLFREFGTPDSQLMRGVINSFWYFVATVVVGIPLTILLAYFIYKKFLVPKYFALSFSPVHYFGGRAGDLVRDVHSVSRQPL